MSDCQRITDQLVPYADGLLAPEERDGIARHLDACPPCRVAAQEVEGGRLALREHASSLASVTLPPGLRSRCEAALQQRPAGPQWWQTRLVAGFTVALLVLGTIAILFTLATQRSELLLAQQLTADHMKCFMLFDANAGVDAGAAERTLRQRYGFSVHIPPSSAANGVTLIGARRCLYASGQIPHVMYKVQGENVSLFMLDGERREAADLVTLGHHSKIWSQGERTFVLVSSRADSDLTQTARYVMQQTVFRGPR